MRETINRLGVFVSKPKRGILMSFCCIYVVSQTKRQEGDFKQNIDVVNEKVKWKQKFKPNT